jgi:hypothetical protein
MALILKHLLSGKEINPLEALSEYGVYRLGAIIFNLKQEGYNISTRKELFEKPSGRKGHYAVYRLEEADGII